MHNHTISFQVVEYKKPKQCHDQLNPLLCGITFSGITGPSVPATPMRIPPVDTIYPYMELITIAGV